MTDLLHAALLLLTADALALAICTRVIVTTMRAAWAGDMAEYRRLVNAIGGYGNIMTVDFEQATRRRAA